MENIFFEADIQTLLKNERLIISFFGDHVFADLIRQGEVIQTQENQVLLYEGDVIDSLMIPLAKDVLSVKNYSSPQEIKIGYLKKKSELIFQYVLEGRPSPYTVVGVEANLLLKIPKSALETIWKNCDQTYSFLSKSLGHSDLQNLIFELKALQLSNEFIVHFIAALQLNVTQKDELLSELGTVPDKTYLLLEGSLNSFQAHSALTWEFPLKSWVNWVEFTRRQPAQVTITVRETARSFSLSSTDFTRVAERSPKDALVMQNWIERGQFKVPGDYSEESELQDFKNLFSSEALSSKGKGGSFPWVQQNDEMDCGPACLAMVSQYFGKKTTLQFWRARLSTDQNGTNLFDMAKTAERFGFISHCLEVEDLRTIDHFLFPFIGLRKYHYVVIHKVKNNEVFFADPAIGIRKLSIEEFSDGFENVGLFLKPSADFKNLSVTKPSWKYLSIFLHGLKRDLALGGICAIIGVLLSLVPPLLTQVVLDEVLAKKNVQLFGSLLLALVVSTVMGIFVSWAERYYFIFATGKFNFRAISVFVQKMLSLPYNYFASRHVGDFTHRLSEISHLRHFISTTFIKFVLNVLSIFIYGIVLFMLNPSLAIISILLAPLLALTPILFSRYLGRIYGELFIKSSEQSSFITDLVKGIAAIKSASAEFTGRMRFEEKLIDLVKVENKFLTTTLTVDTITNGLYQIFNLLLLYVAVTKGLKNEISVGQIISFALISSRVFGPILQITKQWDQFVELKAVISRLNDIFLSPSEGHSDQVKRGKVTKSALTGSIEFRDVWFRYGNESAPWVLSGVSFKIEPGQKVSIVGPSGSGKSTIAMLLVRLYEPTRGQILFDGRDYREFDLDWLRGQIGLLHQENFLFHGFLGENIALNKLVINESELAHATDEAAVSEFISSKRNGFFTHIPHGGAGFSGGEKQKISLARLFFKKPNMVILDEATSSLDGISESQVLSQLHTKLEGKTIINIAHRFTTVASSDYAIVLRDGKFSGFGSIEYLMNHNQIFQSLFSSTRGTKLNSKLEGSESTLEVMP